jgi:hypothetical protein
MAFAPVPVLQNLGSLFLRLASAAKPAALYLRLTMYACVSATCIRRKSDRKQNSRDTHSRRVSGGDGRPSDAASTASSLSVHGNSENRSTGYFRVCRTRISFCAAPRNRRAADKIRGCCGNDKTMTFSESRHLYTPIGKRWAIFELLHQLFTESTDGCCPERRCRGLRPEIVDSNSPLCLSWLAP